MATNIEDAFSLEELTVLEDLTNPILNHARIDGPDHESAVSSIHARIKRALRRVTFHAGAVVSS